MQVRDKMRNYSRTTRDARIRILRMCKEMGRIMNFMTTRKNSGRFKLGRHECSLDRKHCFRRAFIQATRDRKKIMNIIFLRVSV